ncbi:hypothetical protein ACH4GK_18725 [Streptomyces rimosus]|uniref:hypothetical protein n=1 Tax=Streptomyces rimosus TaxID=1927 RepID=UPI0004C9C131|nr:hypothetical protein [Streptomyces rimosus]
MKMLPFFEEIEAEGQDLIQRVSLRQLTGQLDPGLREPLATYLSDSHSLLAAGNVQDPLKPEAGPVAPFGYCTDGEWTWPSYWGYFVREHGVKLPDEFIRHAQTRNFTPPTLTEEELDRAEEEFEEQFFA